MWRRAAQLLIALGSGQYVDSQLLHARSLDKSIWWLGHSWMQPSKNVLGVCLCENGFLHVFPVLRIC